MTAGQRWSIGKPKQEGWYWFRTEVTEAEICRIYQDADDQWWATCTEWDEAYKLENILIGAEFQGPITPHDQEAG